MASSVFLGAAISALKYDSTVLSNICNQFVPLIEIYFSKSLLPCYGPEKMYEFNNLAGLQALASATLLCVATPIAALTFRKINQIAIIHQPATRLPWIVMAVSPFAFLIIDLFQNQAYKNASSNARN